MDVFLLGLVVVQEWPTSQDRAIVLGSLLELHVPIAPEPVPEPKT